MQCTWNLWIQTLRLYRTLYNHWRRIKTSSKSQWCVLSDYQVRLHVIFTSFPKCPIRTMPKEKADAIINVMLSRIRSADSSKILYTRDVKIIIQRTRFYNW